MHPPPISPDQTARNRSAARGFTAIELMVTVAILAVLAAMAAPSFTGLMERWRGRQVTEGLQSSLYLARSEAIRRGGNIQINANSNGWSNGWTVAYVAGGVNTPLQTATVPANTSVTLGNATSILVDRWGMLSLNSAPGTAANLDFFIRPTGQDGSASATHLCVTPSGRVNQPHGSAACPP